MKKYLIVIGLLLIITGLSGCGEPKEAIEAKGISFDLPTSWTRLDSLHDLEYYSPDYFGTTIIYDYMEYEGTAVDAQKKEIYSIYDSPYRDSKVLQDNIEVDGQSCIAYSYYSTYDDSIGEPYLEGVLGFHIDVYVIHNDQLYRFLFRSYKEVDDESNDIEKNSFKTMKQILRTVSFEVVDENPIQQ